MNLPQLSTLRKTLLSKIPKRGSKEAAAFVLLDIGSSAVRAAIAKVDDGGITLLGYGQVDQHDQAMLGGVVGSIASVVEKADEAITQAQDTAGQTSDQLILGLGGTLVGGLTTLVHLNRPRPNDKVSEKELQLMLERMSQTALADAEDTMSQEMGVPKEDLRLINSAITNISLDGYPLPSPVDFSGKEVDICLFNAFVSSSTLVALQKILSDINMDLAAVAATPYAQAQAAISLSPKPQQAHWLMIDVGSGSTSVTLVEHGAVVGSKTFPIGGRSITASIARQQEVDMSQAERIKRDYVDGKASESHQHKLKSVIKKEVGLWSAALKLALAEIQPDQALPETVYLIGGGSKLPELASSLKDEDWYKPAGFNQQPAISTFDLRPLGGIADHSRMMAEDDWSILALAYFLQQRQQEDAVVSSAYQRTLQSLATNS